MSRGLHVQLSFQEEIALRRIAHGGVPARPDGPHLVRLQRLMLVERHGSSWRLTPLGRQRYASLPKPLLQRRPPCDEIGRLLGKYQPES